MSFQLLRGDLTADAPMPTALIRCELSDSPGMSISALPDHNIKVVRLVKPWYQDLDLTLLPAGERILLVSAMGEWQGEWYDGPLAHILPDGTFASYVPSGGAAILGVPLAAPHSGASPDVALAAEGNANARAHRCLLARLSSHLGMLTGSDLSLQLRECTPAAAAALALTRQAMPKIKLRLALPASAPATWRRLCQNLAVETRVHADIEDMNLNTLAGLIPSHAQRELFSALNSISDVLPKTLVSSQ